MDKLNGREALYGFVAWLTSRKKLTVMSSRHVVPMELLDQFCDANELDAARSDIWPKNLVYPKKGIK